MGAFVCDCCGTPTCICQDGADHPGGLQHCADPDCLARCAECAADQADDAAVDVAAELTLTRCEQ